MTMTPQQAAEVLQAYKTWKEGKPVFHPIYEDLTAALETAIAVMEAKPTESEADLILKYTGRVITDYPEADKIHLDLWQFASELTDKRTPPTDEQIGEVFKDYANVIYKWPSDGLPKKAMTIQAFILAVRSILTSCNSK